MAKDLRRSWMVVSVHDSSASEYMTDLLKAARDAHAASRLYQALMDSCQSELIILNWFHLLYAASEMVSPVSSKTTN